ncbi:MAG: hypothetical protein NTW96_18495 [Planctomycetia bacterium]|nr:hypothetical protein [Planctomycetia bacterium]
MKPLAESPWKQRGLFFVAGLLVALVCGMIVWHWMSLVPYDAFDQQPTWLKGLGSFVGWLPWIGVAVVLLVRFVKGRSIRVGFYFLGTVTPVAILIGWLCFGPLVEDRIHRQKFNLETWRDQQQGEENAMWPPRLCMVDDLMSSGKLDGLTSSQVVELLGPPHDKSFPFGCTQCDIHYYLGPERGFFRIDSEWLFIALDKDGKVTRYWLYRD